MVVACYGPKDDPTWLEDIEKAGDFLESVRERCDFDKDKGCEIPRRGKGLNALNYGSQHGNGGQVGFSSCLCLISVLTFPPKHPKVVGNQGTARLAVLEDLRKQKSFIRIAGMMNGIFLTWAPILWYYYASIMGALIAQYGVDIWLPFANCIFGSFAVDFGPYAVSTPHRDVKNLAFGWCAITALGAFDYVLGGHLILWDLGLVFEFPPGTTIMVPSSVVCHSNTRIQRHEHRYSFTMYTSGGLFRWVEHGFELESIYQKTVQAARDAAWNATRWTRGLALFSTMEELCR